MAGDLIIVGGVVYALVMLKSGLSRADQWHLVPSILVLVFAFVLPIPAVISPIAPLARRIGLALCLVLAATYTFGHYPQANYVFRVGLIKGFRDLASGVPVTREPKDEPASPALVYDRSYANPDIKALSVFLAAPPQRGRRVFIYGGPWGLSYLVGVAKAGILGDDYIYGDDRGDVMRSQLDRDQETLIVIGRDDFAWLQLGPTAAVPERRFYMLGDGIWQDIRAGMSSVHIRAVRIEEKLKKDRWRRLVGQFIVENYRPIYTQGQYVVLTRNIE